MSGDQGVSESWGFPTFGPTNDVVVFSFLLSRKSPPSGVIQKGKGYLQPPPEGSLSLVCRPPHAWRREPRFDSFYLGLASASLLRRCPPDETKDSPMFVVAFFVKFHGPTRVEVSALVAMARGSVSPSCVLHPCSNYSPFPPTLSENSDDEASPEKASRR